MNFDFPVYVISTKRFSDRHESVERQLSMMGLSFEFIFLYDADEIDELTIEKYGLSKLKVEVASTVLKHLEAHRRLLATNARYGLILEDDFFFQGVAVSDLQLVITEILQIPPPWLLFLGGMDNKRSFLEYVKNTIIQKGEITTAEAYLIERQSAEARLEWVETHGINMPADHLLKYIDSKLCIPQYICTNPLFGQFSITGKFRSELDEYRQGKSALWLILRFRLRNFFRQALPRRLAAVLRYIC